MASETRTIRPYSGLGAFERAAANTRVEIGGLTCEAGERLSLTAASMRSDPLIVRIADDADQLHQLNEDIGSALTDLGLARGQTSLLVILSTPYLRLADIVHQSRLDEPGAVPERLEIRADGHKARALLTPNGGCDVQVYFCLADEVDQAPLRPHRKGTWLGRSVFRLRTELGEIGFTPRALTPERRKKLDLPANTIRFVEVDPELLLEDSFDAAVQVYVDESLLGHLSQAGDSAAALAFQRQLFIDALGGVVRAVPKVQGVEALQYKDVQDTVLGLVVESVAGKKPRAQSESDREAVLNDRLTMIRTSPEMFMAHAEAIANPRDDLRVAIGGLDK